MEFSFLVLLQERRTWVNPRFHPIVFMFDINQEDWGKCESKIPHCNSSGGKLLLRPSTSYNNIVDVKHPQWRFSAKIDNFETLTTYAKKHHYKRCTGFQIHLYLERSCKCGVYINFFISTLYIFICNINEI